MSKHMLPKHLLTHCSCRILRPNTPYRLFSVESALCAGGLFYSTSNITQSCIGVLQSFLNTSTPREPGIFKTSRLLLARMLVYIHKQLVLEDDNLDDTGHLPDLSTMDGVLAVLSLINLAELANVLHPDTYKAGVKPEERLFLIHVRKQARHLMQWLDSHYAIEPIPGPGILISSTRKTIPLGNLYLVHQADALQAARKSMEGVGLQPSIPGLTYQALYAQVVGCLGPQVEELLGSADTFYWEEGTHQVSRRRTPLQSNFSKCALKLFRSSVAKPLLLQMIVAKHLMIKSGNGQESRPNRGNRYFVRKHIYPNSLNLNNHDTYHMQQ